jgi:hypothetical protein
MDIAEYIPKQYLLIELPYSKIVMNYAEAIELNKPIGAFLVPPEVWLRSKSNLTLNQMKLSGELTSSFAADGTEWLSCSSPRHPVRAKQISTASRVSIPNQFPRVIQGLCGCCGDAIYNNLTRCDGCNKVVCLHCTHIFCSNERCTKSDTKSDTNWNTMREDGLKIETEQHLT